ncbi:MAG TPA: DUF1223 domain-containing protein [Burkholderiales bacterium]|nr:DUF1223 domain-containing protein [Burkholderiales bacterium]
MRIALAALLLAALTPAQARDCSAQSGPHTTALVELYTSEGCDSCPPADRWLQGLGARGYAPGRVVPLSLHVNYWDYIGWKDPYAQQRFADRQRRLAQVMRARIVYTPQVLLQGQDFRRWGSGTFDEAVAKINAQPPRASIALHLQGGRGDTLDTQVSAALLDPASTPDAVLYLASYENKLVSSVSAGENRGRTLQHDYVVFEWVGPLPLTGGRIEARHALPLLPKAVRAHSGVAAFVQNGRTAEVLQALMLPACPA